MVEEGSHTDTELRKDVTLLSTSNNTNHETSAVHDVPPISTKGLVLFFLKKVLTGMNGFVFINLSTLIYINTYKYMYMCM